MKTRRGFTLMEVCVVLAVVLILSALVLSVMARVREKSRQASCQSNLRQIYLGLVQYVADNDSYFPSFVNWSDSLTPYTKTQQVFFCPSVPQPRPPKNYIGDVDVDYGYAVGFLNTLILVPRSDGLPGLKLTGVGVNEAVTVDISKLGVSRDALTEGFSQDVRLSHGAACGITASDGTPTETTTASTIHNGGGNILFYDGRVKWLSPRQVAKADCEMGQLAQPPFRAGGPHIP